MFRAADAARLAQLYLIGGTPHPATERARLDKTALGSLESVPWTYAVSPEPVLAGLRARGYQILALEVAPDSRPLGALTAADFPLALLVGHETAGLPAEVVAACDGVVTLESWGRKQSLNVALAFGVAMLHCARLWAEHVGCAPGGEV